MGTPIRGRDAITATDALAIIRAASPNDVNPDQTVLYVAVLVSLCGEFGLRPTVLLAQWHHETAGGGPSGRWRELNPAGLGITSSADATPYRITSGGDAARLHVWSMLVALRDWEAADRVSLPPSASSWRLRWQQKYADPGCPVVANVEDLNLIYAGNRATWATDPAYHTKLLATMRRLFPQAAGESENAVSVITFGRVPHPHFYMRPITKGEGKGQNNLGKRSIEGVVWHRMLGSLNGTDGYFRRDDVNALTDYGIGVLATDGAAFDGTIYRWNDPLGYQSGWASGKVIAPWGDGLKFVNKYGVDAVNRRQVSIEISGHYQTPVSDPARDAVVALTAYFADQDGIPWDRFPIRPKDGFSFVRWHNEFTGMAEKECPGAFVMVATDDWIGRVKALLRHYQVQDAPAPDPKPVPIPVSPIPKGASLEWLRVVYGSVSVPWASQPFTFDLNRSECRQWLAWCTQDIPEDGDYTDGNWGALKQVIRRGNKGDRGRDFVYDNGLIVYQEPPDRQRG